MIKAKKFELKIETYTWEKDNYELFDYETKQVQKQSYESTKTGELIRYNNQVDYIEEQQKVNPENINKLLAADTKILLEIQQKSDDLIVVPSEQQQLWQVVTNNQSELQQGMKIHEGDTIKLGKKIYYIKKIINTDYQQEFTEHYDKYTKKISNLVATFLSEQNPEELQNNEERQSQLCRICLSHSIAKNNPLISPCSCNGSMRWIHFDCLKYWIQSKITVKINDSMAEINSKAIKCELCLEFFPPSFRISNESFQLFDYGINYTKYVMIEDKDGPIYILNFSSKNILTVGRGHDCDFKIGEITVSRQHMEMKMENNNLFIKDKGSKFGSLLLIMNYKKLNHSQDYEFQCGRTLIRLRRKNIKGFFDTVFGFCCSNNIESKDLPKKKKKKNMFIFEENNQ